MKGLLVHVFRSGTRFRRNMDQVSNQYDQMILIGDNIKCSERPWCESVDPVTLYLQEDKDRKYIWCTPVKENKGDEKWTPYMAGGNFVYSSDSRFPSKYPIPIHDRRETWDNYNILTRD